MLNHHEKQLVQSTWTLVIPIRDAAAAIFYEALFERDPALRDLFPQDLAEQKRKLMAAVSAAVVGLNQPEQLIPMLRDMGRKHLAYGVQDKDYETVGAALLWTLEKGLGEDWTPEVAEAWTKAYTLISDTMRDGAAALSA
ncbi:MAG TPA: globin family protein [Holophagaceae bacterium]|nr:globin family protein [Holophagaceae bacterium]